MVNASDAGHFLAQSGAAVQNALHLARGALGNSTAAAEGDGGVGPQTVGSLVLPAIPAGVSTTIISVRVPLSDTPQEAASVIEEADILAAFVLAGFVWLLPWMCANTRFCCRGWKRCMSRSLRWYFCIGLVVNLTLISVVIAYVPHITANQVFFAGVKVIEKITDSMMTVLIRLACLLGAIIAYSFREAFVRLLGFDAQFLRLDLKDILTGFSMHRFKTVEISFLKAEDLPGGYGQQRSLFLRVVLGQNEPLHSRPRDGCTNSVSLRERMQMNFDPEDETQKLTVMIKQQEVIGQAVAQLAPAAGALVGGVSGIAVSGIAGMGGPMGATAGALTGIGTANSLGPEIARVDMSSSMVNRMRLQAQSKEQETTTASRSTAPVVPWREDFFVKVDLVPQGHLWLKISDVNW